MSKAIWPSLILTFGLFVGLSRGLSGDDQPAEPDAGQPRLLIVLIGGLDSDPTPAQILGTAPRKSGNSGLFQLRGDLASEPRITPEYFNWNGTRAGEIKSREPPRARGIAEFIRAHVEAHPRDRIALVGNSWGGHTALEAAQLLSEGETPVPIDLVVFLDASSAGRGPAKPKGLPDNLTRIAHYYTRNSFVWGPLPESTRLENIDLGDADNGYLRESGAAYAARFDFRAHVAAEWDERIHADIRRRLLDLIGQGERGTLVP